MDNLNFWKSRILISYLVFYSFVYIGRFSHWVAGPEIQQELNFTHIELGILNACLLWGFAAGDIFHGRLAETYGMRVWILIWVLISVCLNWITSFGNSLMSIAIPWGLNGFANAAAWAPGVSILSQWWPKTQRGRVFGLVGVSSGVSMLLMWGITGWTAGEFGWRAAFRYPPILMGIAVICFFFLVRDRPSNNTSAKNQSKGTRPLNHFKIYKGILFNWHFIAISNIKGLENVVRYGLPTWVPIYYFQESGLSFESITILTIAMPIGFLSGPLLSGWISDKLLNARRKPMIVLSAIISASALFGLAIISPTNVILGAFFLVLGTFASSLSLSHVGVIDMFKSKYAGTSSGLFDAHGYIYAGAQAIIFSIILDVTNAPWAYVFLAMAFVRILSALILYKVKI